MGELAHLRNLRIFLAERGPKFADLRDVDFEKC
jgi:hypothetical protein